MKHKASRNWPFKTSLWNQQREKFANLLRYSAFICFEQINLILILSFVFKAWCTCRAQGLSPWSQSSHRHENKGAYQGARTFALMRVWGPVSTTTIRATTMKWLKQAARLRKHGLKSHEVHLFSDLELRSWVAVLCGLSRPRRTQVRRATQIPCPLEQTNTNWSHTQCDSFCVLHIWSVENKTKGWWCTSWRKGLVAEVARSWSK